ncbi:MAG: alpha,2-fucosyltransferase, partial [Sporomusa sp.]|nr:alpha,2-fucosyltransferase [Sporomusa sp.]
MIVVQLTGGLGNQMFGYACGRALALRTGKQLYLDLSSYPVHPLRRYELDKLNIQAPPPIHSLGVLEEIKCKMDIKSLKVVNERK